jgi:L-ascorbate metabolism protein UlaG (beta-lactamase superfamily)
MSHGVTVTWHGHSTWSIRAGASQLLIDPFLDENPAAKTRADHVSATHILISHAHFDHLADAAVIAQRTGAQVLANYEIATWLETKHGVRTAQGMNLGGGLRTPFGRVVLVPALHSSSLPDGSYGGTAGGWWIELDPVEGSVSAESTKIYYAGDTALFSDMHIIAREGVDAFIVPIGDLFTMGPADSIHATNFVQPRYVIPTHYNTWPPIAQDTEQWADSIRSHTRATPIVPHVDVPFQLFR